jgi:hypothetical protein
MIYSTNENEMYFISENTSIRIEDKFVNEVCEIIMDTLNVNHNERRLMRPLLQKIIGDKLNVTYKQEGLLQQFTAYILDKSIKLLKDELNISSNVNHENAYHAKFSDIVNELKNKIK